MGLPATSGVYRLTVTKTGEAYIGSSQNMRVRAQQHLSEIRLLRRGLLLYTLLAAHGLDEIAFDVLELCEPAVMYERELHWIAELKPALNQYKNPSCEVVYTDEERVKKAERVRKLWATPGYHEKASQARRKNSFAKGYKCTPEQVLNRKRAARISHMKRKHGEDWRAAYRITYPEHAGDADG